MMKPNLGLSEVQRKSVVKLLGVLLADEQVLLTRLRNYHWNVTGPNFNELHAFFQAQYTEVSVIVDDVAERIRQLGDMAPGTMTEYLKATRLQESPGSYPAANLMLENLVRDHESIIRSLRADVDACATKHGDVGTSDFLTGLMEQHEKMAWLARSHV